MNEDRINETIVGIYFPENLYNFGTNYRLSVHHVIVYFSLF